MCQTKGNVLIIGDTHIPFEHPYYLEFCKQIEREFKCKKVVHIGDLVDSHAINFHEHNPDGFSSGKEVQETREHLVPWLKAFPNVLVCKGNHDLMINRRAIQHGISEEYLKKFTEMWNFPKGWEYHFYYILNKVRYEHGTGYSGHTAHMKIAQKNRQSTVIGHTHSVGDSNYLANDLNAIFGLSVGCGIDRMRYAFYYGKDFVDKPILGCGVVLEDGKQGYFIPMSE